MRKEGSGERKQVYRTLRFMKDHLGGFLLNLCGMAALSVFLLGTGYRVDGLWLILVVWSLVYLTALLVRFLRRRAYFTEVFDTLDRMEQKYLIAEVMQRDDTMEGELYEQILRASNRAVIEKIHGLEDSQRDYRDYVENWAHEIKTPLTSLELICNNNRDSNTRRLLGELARAEHDVEMMLYYANVDAIAGDYRIEPVQLQQLCNETIMKNRELLKENGAAITVECGEIQVNTDKRWVSFILSQLFLNAVKYKKDSGTRIQIAACSGQEKVTLTITDQGMGIRPEDIERIFEKGFTGENGRKGQKSSGMGLYLCQKMSTQLGIDLTATSIPGQCTTMTLQFPSSSYYILDA